MKKTNLTMVGLASLVACATLACSSESAGTTGDDQALTKDGGVDASAPIACDKVDQVTLNGGGQVQLLQCVQRSTAGAALDMLRVRYVMSSGPGSANSGLFTIGNVFLQLGETGGGQQLHLGAEGFQTPMECHSLESGASGGRMECDLTLKNVNVRTAEDRGRTLVVPDFFKFARRENGSIVNVWALQLSFDDGDGRFDNLNGQNFHARFGEKTF